MATTTTHTLTVSTCTLDAQCKATLEIMLRNGWTEAHTVYATNQQIISVADLQHLLENGAIGVHAELQRTLTMRAPKNPRPEDELYFKLGVNLA